MKEFEELEKCPVCAEPRFGIKNAEVWRKFHMKYHLASMLDEKCLKYDEAPKGSIKINHVHIECSKCGYEWIESPYIEEYIEEG